MQFLLGSGRLAVLTALALALALASTPTSAHDVTAGPLVIKHPWARATPAGAKLGGGYLTIDNKGDTPDRLVGGSLDASAGFELHAMSMDGGIMRMRPVGPLEIPAAGSIMLAPSGTHIMFTGLKRGLKKGETVSGTLVFETAGTVPVRFDVEAIGAKAPDMNASDQAGHDMSGLGTD